MVEGRVRTWLHNMIWGYIQRGSSLRLASCFAIFVLIFLCIKATSMVGIACLKFNIQVRQFLLEDDKKANISRHADPLGDNREKIMAIRLRQPRVGWHLAATSHKESNGHVWRLILVDELIDLFP